MSSPAVPPSTANQVLAWINVGTTLLAVLGPLAESLALKIKHNLELTPDVQVNITNLAGEAHTANAETIAVIDAWKQANGF